MSSSRKRVATASTEANTDEIMAQLTSKVKTSKPDEPMGIDGAVIVPGAMVLDFPPSTVKLSFPGDGKYGAKKLFQKTVSIPRSTEHGATVWAAVRGYLEEVWTAKHLEYGLPPTFEAFIASHDDSKFTNFKIGSVNVFKCTSLGGKAITPPEPYPTASFIKNAGAPYVLHLVFVAQPYAGNAESGYNAGISLTLKELVVHDPVPPVIKGLQIARSDSEML